jgi:hypothetical protein
MPRPLFVVNGDDGLLIRRNALWSRQATGKRDVALLILRGRRACNSERLALLTPIEVHIVVAAPATAGKFAVLVERQIGLAVGANPIMLRTDYRFENADELNYRAIDLDRDDVNCVKESGEPAQHYRVRDADRDDHDGDHDR